MTLKHKALQATIKNLQKCLTAEAEAIVRRDFSAIADLTKKKVDLTREIEESLTEATQSLTVSLRSALHEVQHVAQSNANRLQALRDGAARARRRLQELTDQKSHVGVYQSTGLPLRARSSSRGERTV